MSAEARATSIRSKQRQPRRKGGDQDYTIVELDDDDASALARAQAAARERAQRGLTGGRG